MEILGKRFTEKFSVNRFPKISPLLSHSLLSQPPSHPEPPPATPSHPQPPRATPSHPSHPQPPRATPSYPQPPRAGLSSHNPPTSSRSGDLTVADLEIASRDPPRAQKACKRTDARGVIPLTAANDHRKELTTPGKGGSLAPSPIWYQAAGDLSHRRRSGQAHIWRSLSPSSRSLRRGA
uniref:Uncharacterized protein n=1 Tax=Fagus sylvatica TaxID=28930 RepID=A0A2N9H268_FAGSY